jgi:hypothetical protein
LDTYNKLTHKTEKADFFAKYLQSKKFDFLEIKEERSCVTEMTSKESEGWMSKYQIADLEKLAVDHPLMEKKKLLCLQGHTPARHGQMKRS